MREKLEELARRVRGEAGEFFGFVEPQASRLVGCCGEVCHRLMVLLSAEGVECRIVSIRFQSPDAYWLHGVLLCGDEWLVDASVTQFEDESLRQYRVGEAAGRLSGDEDALVRCLVRGGEGVGDQVR